jgi:hypothetical protein
MAVEVTLEVVQELHPLGNPGSKYPPAKPGALGCEPLKAASFESSPATTPEGAFGTIDLETTDKATTAVPHAGAALDCGGPGHRLLWSDSLPSQGGVKPPHSKATELRRLVPR